MATDVPAPAPLSYRITSYWQRKRGSTGLTQCTSKRLNAIDVLNWVLHDLPEEAIGIGEEDETGWITVRLHLPSVNVVSPPPRSAAGGF